MNKSVATNTSLWPRNLIIGGVLLLLAPVIGFLVSRPDRPVSLALVGLVIAFLTLPIFLRWHHPLLVFTWNAGVHAFFVPGSPALWMVFGGISLGLTVLTCILNKKATFQHVPSITWSLIFLVVVVVVTAKLAGGLGFRVFGGSTFGGKGYVFILAAVIGYFALSATRIPPERAQLFATLFFAAGITFAISNLIYLAGPMFYFLYAFFPIQYAYAHYTADMTGDRLVRLAGIGFAALAISNVLLLRYGVRGLLDVRRPWRLGLFVAGMALSTFGGFRSTLLLLGLIFAIQFCVEGLHRTRYLLAVASVAALGLVILIPFSSKLPLTVQRTLTPLPFLELDPAARAAARASLDWRFDMWRMLVPEVRAHLFRGKGYALNPTDLWLADESVKRGFAEDFYGAVVSGDYHSGPLSLIIPFGIFGVAAFLWVLIAGGRVIYLNWKYSDPSLRNINSFLWSAFLTKLIFYCFFFGAFSTDIAIFLGLVGLSLAINGVPRKASVKVPSLAAPAAPAVDVELAYQR